MAKNKSNHSARYRNAMVDESTHLKRRVKDLESALFHWNERWTPIAKAVTEGDNLRAIALIKGVKWHGTKE